MFQSRNNRVIWTMGLALAWSSAVCLLTTSCDPNAKPADGGVNFQKASENASSNQSNNLADDMPVPPKDAQYTIFCRDFNDPAHVQTARTAQHMLAQETQFKKWYIVHAADHSTLYYGFYTSNDKSDKEHPAEVAEAKRLYDDLNTIRQMQDSEGNRLFSASLPVLIDSPDPQANPAWDITRTRGAWSIEIAVYANTPDRKQNAVDSVRNARSQGIDAYYYHGDTASSVCIGCWPEEAAIEIQPDKQNVDPDKPLLVTPAPLSDSFRKQMHNPNMQAVAPHVEVQDPTLRRELGRWKEHSTNGQTLMRRVVDSTTGLETTEPERPFLFRIPHKDPLDTIAPAQTATVAPPVQPARPSGVGQLPSLGD